MKLTCACVCHGLAAMRAVVPPIAMHGWVAGAKPPRANKAARTSGNVEARILKRNMIRYSLARGVALWFAERKQKSLPSG